MNSNTFSFTEKATKKDPHRVLIANQLSIKIKHEKVYFSGSVYLKTQQELQ